MVNWDSTPPGREIPSGRPPNGRRSEADRLFTVEPDPRLLQLEAEIQQREMERQRLRRRGLLAITVDMFRQLLNTGGHEADVRVAQLTREIEDLRAQGDLNYAGRLQNRRRRVEQMHNALDQLHGQDNGLRKWRLF